MTDLVTKKRKEQQIHQKKKSLTDPVSKYGDVLAEVRTFRFYWGKKQ